jgi:hypothetical protein
MFPISQYDVISIDVFVRKVDAVICLPIVFKNVMTDDFCVKFLCKNF